MTTNSRDFLKSAPRSLQEESQRMRELLHEVTQDEELLHKLDLILADTFGDGSAYEADRRRKEYEAARKSDGRRTRHRDRQRS